MNSSPYSQAARQFLDFWQKQLASAVNDRDFIHAMLEMLRSAQAPQGGAPDYAAKQHASDPAAAPDALRERLDGLDFRLGMLEQRLAALEAAAKLTRKPGVRARGAKRGAAPRKSAARRG